MEAYRVCEKDTKTKAYSKEGLARMEAEDGDGPLHGLGVDKNRVESELVAALERTGALASRRAPYCDEGTFAEVVVRAPVTPMTAVAYTKPRQCSTVIAIRASVEQMVVPVHFRHLAMTETQLTLSEKVPFVFCRGAAQVAGANAYLERQLGDRAWFNGNAFGWGDLSVVPAVQAATYYVRSDGGDASQCTGRSDARYPGSGSNQACAWKHPFIALPPAGTSSTGTVVTSREST